MAKDKGINIVTDARTCFLGSEAGKRTLANMLTEAGFFKLNHTPEEQSVVNFVKILLGWTGSFPIEGHSSKDRIDKFVSMLCSMESEY